MPEIAKVKVKPYYRRVKNWKVRNMVICYLSARTQFRKTFGGPKVRLQKIRGVSFETMREICDVLYEIKEDHHLIYKRLLDPKKQKFDDSHKFAPDEMVTAFMNNTGLLFHKVMVARELKYVIDHYLEGDDRFERNVELLQRQLDDINLLFDDGLEIIERLIQQNKENTLLLIMLLEKIKEMKKHFGKRTEDLILGFGNGGGKGEVYFRAGQYQSCCGRSKEARDMYKLALKYDRTHSGAKNALVELDA
jgi:hypothetical protein